MLSIIGKYDGVVVRSSTKITEKILKQAENLKIVGRAGIGVDNIDVDSATENGVVVMNTPFGNAITTAEHAIALILGLMRNLPKQIFLRMMESGKIKIYGPRSRQSFRNYWMWQYWFNSS